MKTINLSPGRPVNEVDRDTSTKEGGQPVAYHQQPVRLAVVQESIPRLLLCSVSSENIYTFKNWLTVSISLRAR